MEIEKNTCEININEGDRHKIRFIVDLMDLKDDLDLGAWYLNFMEEYGFIEIAEFISLVQLLMPESRINEFPFLNTSYEMDTFLQDNRTSEFFARNKSSIEQ